MLLQFLHFLLIEGFHDHSFAGYYVVKGIAKIFESVVHAFDFGSKQIAGSEYDEPVEVDV